MIKLIDINAKDSKSASLGELEPYQLTNGLTKGDIIEIGGALYEVKGKLLAKNSTDLKVKAYFLAQSVHAERLVGNS